MTQAEGEEAQAEIPGNAAGVCQSQAGIGAEAVQIPGGETERDPKEDRGFHQGIQSSRRIIAYIIAYDDANSFIYNKDTLYNITNDLVEGLNAEYKKPK